MTFNKDTQDKLYSYFTQRWGMWDYTRGWLKGDCPICGKEKKFGIQIEENRAHCFSCDEHYTIFKYITEVENLKEYNDVYKIIKTYQSGDRAYTKASTDLPGVEKRALALPDEYRLLGLYNSRTAKLVEQNLKGRGFNINRLMRKGIGYCASGEYGGRIIIPYYEGGNLVYFNARKFIDVGEKFKNPTKNECGVGKSEVIYNIDALSLYERVWLFESTTNALTIGDNAIGTGGKSLSVWQKNKILQSQVKDIIIGLDDDAYKFGLKLAMELVNYKRVKVLRFPKDKDANNIGRKATIELHKQTNWQTYTQLYKLYINE